MANSNDLKEGRKEERKEGRKKYKRIEGSKKNKQTNPEFLTELFG